MTGFDHVIDVNVDKYWAAQVCFCRVLGIPYHSATDPEGEFRVGKALACSLAYVPWRWLRLAAATGIYWECRLHIDMLCDEADQVRTESNAELTYQILDYTRFYLVKESTKDWPELGGLAIQKLRHLDYHEEIKTWDAELNRR